MADMDREVTFHRYLVDFFRDFNEPKPLPTFMSDAVDMSDKIERFKVRLDSEECRAERAAHNLCGAIADFTIALKDARTPAEAHRIHAIIAPLVSALESTERLALKRTEELNP